MIHPIKDTDTEFIIDSSTRLVKNVDDVKSMLVQFDHNSERFTFKVPRYVDEHDLNNCNKVCVHYINVDKNKKLENKGVYTITDLDVCPDDKDYVCCSWIISKQATQLAGSLIFVIRFECVNDDTGKVEYAWNTGAYNGVTIASGIYHEEFASDNPIPAYNYVTTLSGDILKFFVGTQAEYDALIDDQKENLFAIITDDTTKEDLFAKIDELTTASEEQAQFKENILNGNVIAKKAKNTDNATHAVSADNATHAEKTTKDAKDNVIDLTYAKINSLTSGAIKPKNAEVADATRIVQKLAETYTTDEYGKIEIELEGDSLYMISVCEQGEPTSHKIVETFIMYIEQQTVVSETNTGECDKMLSTYSGLGAHCRYDRPLYRLGTKVLRCYQNDDSTTYFKNAKVTIMRLARNKYLA